MTSREPPEFLAGVIEGFYGKPWTRDERFELFDWLAGWGLNTYLYAPKDDLKHRVLWREPYSDPEGRALAELIQGCRGRNLRFVYALSPGLDLRCASDADRDRLRVRFQQMLALGCRDFALLFDDIPDRLDPEDRRRWGSLAAAHCQVANAMFRWTLERSPGARFLFCPTPYCGRMAERKLGGEGYLTTIGRELAAGIDVLWTGPEIVSREITPSHAGELQALLRRKPLIWDNLQANDYDGNRFFCGPCAGRSPELRNAVSGLLANPNTELPLNYVPIRTLAEYVRCEGVWDPRAAYLAALREWLPRFDTGGSPVAFDDLLLLADCYYLPHEEGPEARALYDRARWLLARPPSAWGEEAAGFRREAGRLRSLCARLGELRDRPLFHALSRRLWELREELDLLDRCVEHNTGTSRATVSCRSDFHLPGTCRGGMVRRLQRLLELQPDGTFRPGPAVAAAPSTLRDLPAGDSNP